jgi:hypothetical protein
VEIFHVLIWRYIKRAVKHHLSDQENFCEFLVENFNLPLFKPFIKSQNSLKISASVDFHASSVFCSEARLVKTGASMQDLTFTKVSEVLLNDRIIIFVDFLICKMTVVSSQTFGPPGG